MRASTKYALSLVSAIVVAAVAFYLYMYIQMLPAASVPGQYPINERRPTYSGATVQKSYSPSADMGSDELPPSLHVDAKMRCATSSNGMC
jgi:hypothetical protein